MKTVAVFFDRTGAEEYPMNVEEYRIAYGELADMVSARNARFVVVREQSSFLGHARFSRYWEYDGSAWIHRAQAVTADIVYDKGHFQTDRRTPLLNDPLLDRICTDKWETYTLFQDISPPTYSVLNHAELLAAAKNIRTPLAVAKPRFGEEGKGVFIEPPERIARRRLSVPYILQKCIDTSGGIPRITPGLHDLRMIAINGEIVVSYVRTPPPGERTANVARGGKETEVLPETIPAEARAIAARVDKVLGRFARRVYSIDVGFDRNDGCMLIELNSKPGLSPTSKGKQYAHFLERLADALVS